jgi:hypothetical protein
MTTSDRVVAVTPGATMAALGGRSLQHGRAATATGRQGRVAPDSPGEARGRVWWLRTPLIDVCRAPRRGLQVDSPESVGGLGATEPQRSAKDPVPRPSGMEALGLRVAIPLEERISYEVSGSVL